MRKSQKYILLFFLSLKIYFSYAQSYSKLPPGFDNMVRCVEYDSTNNLLYAGGNFYYEGLPPLISSPVNKIAVWDGTSWDSLGSGVTQPGFLLDLIMYNGNLLAAGNFNEIGGVQTKGLGIWNGASWQYFANLYDSSATTSYGAVNVIREFNNELYVGGSFNRVNGTIANAVAKYDGSVWSVFPFIEQYTNIADINIYNNEMYIGGNFYSSNGTLADIAKFNGVGWDAVGGGFSGSFDLVNSLEVYNGKLIVGGSFNVSTGSPGNNIVAWDGNSWSTLGSGLNFAVISMEAHDSFLYAAGIFTLSNGQALNRIAKWDGINWSPVGQNQIINNGISDFTFGDDKLFIGGGFNQINGDTMNFIAKMDLSTSLFENLTTNNNLILYPNPNEGIFTIYDSRYNFKNKPFEIKNAMGICVFSGICHQDKFELDLSNQNLSSGVYVLQIKYKNEILNYKFNLIM